MDQTRRNIMKIEWMIIGGFVVSAIIIIVGLILRTIESVGRIG